MSLSVVMTATADDVTIARCEYWLDHDFASRAELPVSPDGVFEHSFDVSEQTPGLHAIAVRFCDSRGLWSMPVLRHYVKVAQEPVWESHLEKLYYWLDYDKDNAVETSCADGVVEMQLDVTALTPGLHTFSYMFSENNGLYSSPVTRFFIVPLDAPKGFGLISGYEYWFNHGKRHFVEVSPSETLELTDVTVDVVGAQPMSIPENYIFNVADLTVVCPQSDLFFGIQAVGQNGGRSEAVVSDTAKVDLTVVPDFQDLTLKSPVELQSPCGGMIAGLKMPVDVQYPIISVSGSDVKADFYDAAGVKLQPATELTDESWRYTFGDGPVDVAYILLHSAGKDMSLTTVSLDVLPSGIDGVADVTTSISSVDGGLMVRTGENLSVAVYAMTGVKLIDRKLVIGDNMINLTPGCYVVTVSDGTTARVVVR
jgi:hypothetical protein